MLYPCCGTRIEDCVAPITLCWIANLAIHVVEQAQCLCLKALWLNVSMGL